MENNSKEIFTNSTVVIPLVGGVLLAGVLLFTIQSVLSPFLILAAIVFLLLPIRQIKLARTLMWLAFLLFITWFIYELGGVLLPFIISFLLAYIFNPFVCKLEAKKIPRWFSSLGVIVIVLSILISGVVLIMPVAINQFQSILSGISGITGQLVAYIKDGRIFIWLGHFGLPVEYSKELLTEQLSPRLEGILKDSFAAVLQFFSSASNIITQFINLIIIPFLTFYLLKDFPVIIKLFKSWLPDNKRETLIKYFSEVDNLFGKYFRGALMVAFIHGVLASLLLWMFGINYPLMLGMIAGILSIIPYVGLFISLSLSIIVALFSGEPTWLRVIYVLITYGFLQILEASVLSPNILGKQVGLHPVLLILSLLVFGYFAGFIGLLIAVPSTALIILTIKLWLGPKPISAVEETF